MSDFKKFKYYPMEKPKRIQPESPVYIYAYTLAVQQETGASFVQVRLVNRSDRIVHSVFLRVTGLDAQGKHCYEVRFLPLPGCNAKPHSDFGEDHVLFLPEAGVRSLEIMVEDVLFDDGMIWRKQDKHELLTPEQAGWKSCKCGMKNPGEAESCAFCGKRFSLKPQKKAKEPEAAFIYTKMKPLTSIKPIAEEAPKQQPAAVTDQPASWEAPPMWEEPEKVLAEPQKAAWIAESEPTPEKRQEEPTEEASVPSANIFDPQQLQNLSELLAPLRERYEQSEEDQQESLCDVPEDAEEPEMQFDGRTEPEEAEEGQQGTDKSASEPGFMQETNLLMQEIQRRILARQNGETDFTPWNYDREGEQDTQENTQESFAADKPDRGILFWSLMVVLMILLALGGFFGVLYYKGYFR